MKENEINKDEFNNSELNNNSEDDLNTNNNFYQILKNNEEILYENTKLKEEEKRKNEIRLFYYSILELFIKKQYKKIIELFILKDEENEKEESENEENKIRYQNEWIFPFFHIIAIERIIQKKFTKYYKSIKINSIRKYLYMENNILDKWLLLMNDFIIQSKKNKEDIQCFLEFTIEFILTKCLNFSKYCIYKQNIKEAIYFLSLGINLINHTYKFFKSPRTFCLSAELFTCLTSILISDNKFETAKNLLNFSIKLFYISLETIFFCNSELPSYTIFNILNQKKQNVEPIIKLIFFTSISFYHLGVCYENQGNYYFAFYAYKQSKFFISIIKDIDEEIYTFYIFIMDVESRLIIRNRIILFFNQNVKKEKLIEQEKPKIKIINPFTMNKEKKERKFLLLEDYISNMDLIDVDNEDPHLFDKVDKVFKTNVNIATKQIHLLDYLMSDDFKQIIKNMKKININKLDYETINVIQRQIINIKNNEREKLSKQFKKKLKNQSSDKSKNIKNPFRKTINTIPSSTTFSSVKKTRVSSGYKNSQILLTDINRSQSFNYKKSRPSTAQNDKLKMHKNYRLKYFMNNNLPTRSLIINSINSEQNFDFHKNKTSIFLSTRGKKNNKKKLITKYSYDKYLFNKSFMRKTKNLEKQYNNELKFQKKFLKCKEKEIFKPSSFSLKEVQTDCEKFYVTTFDKEMMKIREKKIIFGTDYIKDMVRKKFNNINVNNTFNEFRKTKKFNLIYNNNKENNIINTEENNYKYINNLTKDIDNINNRKKLLVKNFRKKKNLKLESF